MKVTYCSVLSLIVLVGTGSAEEGPPGGPAAAADCVVPGAADARLLNMVSGQARAGSVAKHLEPLPAVLGTGTARRMLRSFVAFGASFSGEASFEATKLQSICLWCDDQVMKPESASRLFERITLALKDRLGNGTLVRDVPNFGDGTEVKSQVMLWLDGDDVIVLRIDVYPTRGGLNLLRRSRVSWQTEMGADMGEYWRATLKEEPQSKPATAATPPTPVALPQVTMTAVEYKIDPVALNRERQDPPFEFRGGPGTGRVVDREGRVLLEPREELGIFGVAVGPDRKMVLVDAGNESGGCCLVLEPATGRRIQLPSRPPGARLFSLTWHWIGTDLLFGTSGVEKIFPEGAHENCTNDNNVAQTKFFTFDLVTERLSEVVMPGAVTQPIVHALEVTGDGHVHLMHEVPQEGSEQDLGWFKIEASKSPSTHPVDGPDAGKVRD